MNPIDQLKSVLCDPTGKCCITGSDEDRAIVDRALLALAQPEQPAKTLTAAEKIELLDWVSACQSAYHIENTPGHRFGGLPGALLENRDALIEHVNGLLANRTHNIKEQS